ncbi:MAG: GAF domain-containing protein, partial [Amnibacterium sp.]
AAALWGAYAVRRQHRSGVLTQRVLLIGSHRLLREQRSRPALARLAEDVADRIWLSTRRGLDCDVVWQLRRGFRAALRDLAALRLWRYDAVVVLTRPDRSDEHRRAGRLSRLRRTILDQVPSTTRVLTVALADPAAAHPRIGRSGFSPSAAAGIVRGLRLPPLDPARRDTLERDLEDPDRETVVDALRLTGRATDELLQRLVEQAGDRFIARFAELNVVGRGAQWSLAAAGLDRGTRSSEGSLCDLSVHRAGPTVIEDTLREMPIDRIPRLPDGRLVRFYAGHPIQSIEGHHIGVLCVYDVRPHRVGSEDVSALRDLALRAEARLIGV